DENAGEEGVRFNGLTRLDESKTSFVRASYDDKISLKGLCDAFRNYAAGKLKLYYGEDDIRRFISGMAVSHILILQGMSGTGKTSLAYAFGEFLGNTSTVIPVQPMWKERTDLIGYFNEFTKRFNETDLLKKMYEANYSRDIYITVLDEMNIARVEYYFAEFLSLLELPDADKRQLAVVSDEWERDPAQMQDGHIKLPENMWFIGTANNDDSTFAISDKVYDRAMVMDLDSKAEPFIAPKCKQTHISFERFEELVKEAQSEYCLTERNKRRLEKLDEYLISRFHITFGNRIMKQIQSYIPVYVSCGGGELEALDDILAKKVMRKLGMQNPVYIRNNAEKLIRFMDE
ncbi:MAG: AAA family ATPase, partial [Clostridia bacterium]|nr:AAA family ATPase [Clostridia bacterium]